MKKMIITTVIAFALSQPAIALEKEWKMVVKHYDSIAKQSHEMITDVTYDSGRKCHRDAYLMNVNAKDGAFSNLTTSDMVRYFCVVLPKK
jgi:hypothetical protein